MEEQDANKIDRKGDKACSKSDLASDSIKEKIVYCPRIPQRDDKSGMKPSDIRKKLNDSMDLYRFLRILIFGGVIISLVTFFLWLYFHDKNKDIFESKINNFLGDRYLAICQLKTLTVFSWEKVYVTAPIALFSGRINFTFKDTSGEDQVISLSSSKYSVYEDYILFSPTNKWFSPNDYLLVTKQSNATRKYVLLQIINENTVFFYNKIRDIILQQDGIVSLEHLAGFKVDSLTINNNRHNHFCEFIFQNDRNKITYILPTSIINFASDKAVDSTVIRDQMLVLKFSNDSQKNGYIFMKIEKEEK